MDTVIPVYLGVCAVGCGVMAGVYFTFSAFVMRSLARLDPAAGIAAMQSINDVILRSAFLPLFFATTLAAAGAVILGLTAPDRAGAGWMMGGGALYVAGMFVCTVVFNVPLNERLKAVDPASAHGAEIWALYLRRWVPWNHVRTVASTAATILFIMAL